MNNLRAVALCNNAAAVIVWVWDGVIPDCLGFSLRRIDKTTGEKTVIKSRLVKFKGETSATAGTTDEHPIQGCKWVDGQAKEGGTYQWEVVPMIGKPGALQPGEGVLTNEATLGVDYGPYIKACFNRGHLVSTQALANMLPQTADGAPDPEALVKAINDPSSKIFKWLALGLPDFVRLPYEEAKKIGGHVLSLYYELSAPSFVKYLKDNQSLWSMVLGNAGKDDETNKAARADFHANNANVTDRMIPEGGIAHNKSAVLRNKDGKPVKTLLQSANPTSTGFCTQANHAIYIDSEGVAEIMADYWERTRVDSSATPIQSSEYRAANAKIPAPVVLADGTSIQPVFSPSTQEREKPRVGPDGKTFTLLDMAASTKTVKGLLLKSKQGIYFVAFYPGSPSFLDVVTWLQYKHPELTVWGTVSSTQALPRPPRKPGTTTGTRTRKPKTNEAAAAAVVGPDTAPTTATTASPAVQSAPAQTSVAAPIIEATPAKLTNVAVLEKAADITVQASETPVATQATTAAPIPTTVPATTEVAAAAPTGVPAATEVAAAAPTGVPATTEVAAAAPVEAKPRRKKFPTIIAAAALEMGWQDWHKELLKLPDAHAITHSKVGVIDPFGDDPTIFGVASDNLGLKASVCNDETMVVIKGNRPLAIAYWVHCQDIHRHFLWRYMVTTGQSGFDGTLAVSDSWQNKFLKGKGRNEYEKIVTGCGLLPKKTK